MVIDVTDRARAYIAKMPPAVSGQRGHDACFAVASALVWGFGLELDTALAVIQDWNSTCDPPWSDRELTHKLTSALSANHDKPRGHLVGDDFATPKSSGNGHVPPDDDGQLFATAAEGVAELERQMGRPRAGMWVYHAVAGNPVGVIVRFDHRDGGKSFRQVSCRGNAGWVLKGMATPRPLYHLPELPNSTGTVYILEGEKTADAARAIGLTATTSSHGSNSASKTDWQALANRDVIVIPDPDKAGEKYIADVLGLLTKVGPSSVRIARLPGLGPKEDLVEFIQYRREDGKDNEAIRQEILDLAEAPTVEPPKPAPAAPAETIGFDWQPINSAEFDAGDYRPEWIIEGIQVARQPMVLGGTLKTVKTGEMMDAGISQASATPFLSRFRCPRPMRVAILSGESGQFTLQETARRICRARGINLADLGDNLKWLFTLPQLSNKKHLAAFRRGLERDRIEVVYVDPLYLCLLAGGGDEAKAENFYQTGPLLLDVARACLEVGATPCLVHHTKKGAGGEGKPISLSDLAYSGIAEFARQWVLLSRREPFDPDAGEHLLWMVTGGSVGHAGLYAVDIAEGRLEADFSGRRWDVTVTNATTARETAKTSKSMEKAQERQSRDRSDETALLAALSTIAPNGEPASYGRVRDLAGLPKERMSQAFERLLAAKIVERCTVPVETGNGAKRPGVGIRRTSENRE